MSIFSKKIIVISLVVIFAVIFSFHWFFVSGMMSAGECLSSNCVYSSSQALLFESEGISLVIFIVTLFAVVGALSIKVDDELKKAFGNFNIYKKAIDIFDYKLNCWFKILETRDPNRNIYGARP